MTNTISLQYIFKKGPRNIRRRLLRDIIIVLLFTSVAILTISFLQGSSIKQDISSKLIAESSLLIRKQFLNYLGPIEQNVQLIGSWGKKGLIAVDDDQRLFYQFKGVFESLPGLSEISFADNEGREFTLFHEDGTYQFSSTSPGEESHDFPAVERFQSNSKYDPQQQDWFKGAAAAKPEGAVFQSESYLLNYVGDHGISASVSWHHPEKPQRICVVSLAISFAEISKIIETLEVLDDVEIFLLGKDGSFLSGKMDGVTTVSTLENSGSKRPLSKAGAKAISLWQKTPGQKQNVIQFKIGNIPWWAGFNTLGDKKEGAWIAVVIPEDVIVADIYEQWSQVGLFIAAILFVGIGMAWMLVRKYSSQLKDLPQKLVSSSDLTRETMALIEAGESTTVEFKSTMRVNLQSGKQGKEIELAWLKTVTAFMNSDGGILLIGVKDDGTILGIDADNFANEDKCRLHFKNLINSHIGTEFSRYVRMKMVEINSLTILVIECERVRQPVFLRVGKNEDYFIRSGPSTMKMTMSQMVKYLSFR